VFFYGGGGSLDPGLSGQRAASGFAPCFAVDAHRRQGRAQARVAEAAVSRTESLAGSERVVPVDGIDGRLDGGIRHRRRAGRVNQVRAAHELNGRVAYAVHLGLFGRPPFQAHE